MSGLVEVVVVGRVTWLAKGGTETSAHGEAKFPGSNKAVSGAGVEDALGDRLWVCMGGFGGGRGETGGGVYGEGGYGECVLGMRCWWWWCRG